MLHFNVIPISTKQVCLVGSTGERVDTIIRQPETRADTTITTTITTSTTPILHRVTCEFGEHGGVDGEGSALIECDIVSGCECSNSRSDSNACTHERLAGGFY